MHMAVLFSIPFCAATVVAGATPEPMPKASGSGCRDTKPPAKLIYHEATIRHRTWNLLANQDRLRALPFDGITINIPASWLAMSNDRWTYADSFENWIEPMLGVLNDPTLGLTDNYMLVAVDRPADWLEDWPTAVANLRDVAAVARDAGCVGIFFDNEEYATPLWNWPDDAETPSAGRAAYESAAREKGRLIGAAMAAEFPEIRVIVLHGPYIADDGVPNSIRRNQFGVGEFELFGPFWAGLHEGLGEEATLIDGGEVYALRTETEFREHAIWRRWALASTAHDASFLTAEDRDRHRRRAEISFGVFPLEFPAGSTMSPAILRTTLEAALWQSDRVTWFYSEEGMSVWEPDEFTQDWMDALTAARDAAQNPPPTARYGIEDLHRVHQQPFDADLNGVIDLEDREAVEGECRLFENDGGR